VRPSIEVRVLATYLGDECEAWTISELARKTGAAYPHVHAAVTGLIGGGVLRARTVGKALYCSPDFSNGRCRALACEANVDRKERLLNAPNLRNMDAEVRRLVIAEPRIVAVIQNGAAVRFLVTEKAAQRDILRKTQLLNLSFSTVDEYRAELLASFSSLRDATVLEGYDRLLLLLSPMQEQLLLNHAQLFRGVKERRRVGR
jgi:hypothetical protein